MRRMFVLLAGVATLVMAILVVFDPVDSVSHDLVGWALFTAGLALIGLTIDVLGITSRIPGEDKYG